MKITIPYPHGCCECDGWHDGPVGCTGPAAYTVERDGKPLRVCTRCVLSSDRERTVLVTEQDDVKLFALWDGLGTFVLAAVMAEERQRRN